MKHEGARVYRFGAFELDVRAGELRKHDIKIRLQEQPLRILVMLLEHPGEVVLREEIRQRLWPNNTIVEFDHGINAAIKRLRDALGESADSPRYIETLERRGYRFKGSVEPVPTAAAAERGNRWWIPAAALFATCGLGLGMYLWLHRVPILTDKDTIVLADFVNRTGDSVFDDTLRQGLAIQLEQSPFLSIISDERIRQTLRLMGQSGDVKLTPEIAREICQRVGSAAVIEGSITSLGSQYVVGVKAIACRTGDLLAEEQHTAEKKEGVLRALGDAAAKLRPKLGESLRTVKKFDTPLEEATTSSLEALQAFTLGTKIMRRSVSAEGVPAMQRAIRLDQNFAMAYAVLGDLYWNLMEKKLAEDSMRKAYSLRQRVSDREKFFIESDYYATVTGDREAALRVFQLWAQTYPRDYNRTNLGYLYDELGEHEKSLAVKLEALHLDPENPSNYASVGGSLILLNRFEEARAICQQALAKDFVSEDLHAMLYLLAFFDNNQAGMAKQVAWSAGDPQEFSMLDLEASTAAYFGRLEKSREFSRRAVNLAELGGLKELAASLENAAAIREAVFGNPVEARERVREHGVRDIAGTALALALAGDTGKAQSLVDELARQGPESTEVRFSYVPTINAQIALRQGSPEKAIELLHTVRPYELGSMGFSIFPVYVRGGAYLAAKRGAEAAAEFQKILDHRGIVLNDPIGALAHLQLGRAFALSGDQAKARAAYQDFLTLWKNADSDIPVFRQAKAEFAKLK